MADDDEARETKRQKTEAEAEAEAEAEEEEEEEEEESDMDSELEEAYQEFLEDEEAGEVDLEGESDEDEEEDEEEDEDEEDEDDAFARETIAPDDDSNVFVVIHRQELKHEDEEVEIGAVAKRTFDTEIVAVCSSLDKAQETACEYVLNNFEAACDAEALVEFEDWLLEGYAFDAEYTEEDVQEGIEPRVHRVLIEPHELA